MKDFAENNLKSDENGRKFSEMVEHAVRKGELLFMSNFPVSHSVFNRPTLQTCKKKGACLGKD